MRDWNDVLPPDVALAQHRWERKRSVAKMRRAGMTLKQAGARLGVSAGRAAQLANGGERILKFPNVCKSPVERYLAHQNDSLTPTLGGQLRLPRKGEQLLTMYSIPHDGGRLCAIVPGDCATHRLREEDPIWRSSELTRHWSHLVDDNSRVRVGRIKVWAAGSA